MEESIIMKVVINDSYADKDLVFLNNDGVIIIKLNNKEICRVDYKNNFEIIIDRMKKIWSD